MNGETAHYLKSRFFRNLFLSYVLLIVVFVVGYCTWYLVSYRSNVRSAIREAGFQKATAFATGMDRTLLIPQSLCSAMNTSESFRSLHQVMFIEKKTVDSLQLYRALSELTRIKAASGSLDVYSILLGFQEDSRLYAPGTVIALNEPVGMLRTVPWIGISSVAELMGIDHTSNMMLNKQFMIYADAYTGAASGAAKGTVLVLIDLSGLTADLRALPPLIGAAQITYGSQVMYASQNFASELEIFEIESLVLPQLRYRLQLSAQAMALPFPVSALLPIGILAVIGALFMFIAYRYLRRRYRPIGAISQMVSGGEEGARQDDMESIMHGIAELIGERNGYREKMITISPYARQGALHQLLSGSMQGAQMEVLQEEQFWSLRRTYFAVGLVNLAVNAGGEQRLLDARSLAAHACGELSDEERTVVTCPRDAQTLYVVVNSDRREGLGDLFYELLSRISEALDDPAIAVTIGVSAVQTEPERLRSACQEASQALENMLTGGRGSVYFSDIEDSGEENSYYFPKDAQKRIVRDLRESNLDDLDALLDALWDKNIRRAELPPATLRRMVDELYACIAAALREISEKNTTHIRIERVREPATIEEIFAYYRTLLNQAVQAYQQEVADEKGNEALQQEICDYINRNILSPSLSLAGVADHFGVSGKFVGMVCKNAFGKTYLQYVRDCQIQHAVHLLQTTELPLEEIAERCGFTNLLTFRRNFKSAMGMNPSDYRK